VERLSPWRDFRRGETLAVENLSVSEPLHHTILSMRSRNQPSNFAAITESEIHQTICICPSNHPGERPIFLAFLILLVSTVPSLHPLNAQHIGADSVSTSSSVVYTDAINPSLDRKPCRHCQMYTGAALDLKPTLRNSRPIQSHHCITELKRFGLVVDGNNGLVSKFVSDDSVNHGSSGGVEVA
jgi:hypothetical protein